MYNVSNPTELVSSEEVIARAIEAISSTDIPRIAGQHDPGGSYANAQEMAALVPQSHLGEFVLHLFAADSRSTLLYLVRHASLFRELEQDKADDILSSIGASNPELRACVSGISQWLHNPGTGTTGGPIGVIDGRQSMRTG